MDLRRPPVRLRATASSSGFDKLDHQVLTARAARHAG
jgi:hypothetical protein